MVAIMSGPARRGIGTLAGAVARARSQAGGSGPAKTQRRTGSALVKAQRRGYAEAVLQGVAVTYRGHPVPQIQRLLRTALGPLGVRLTPPAVRELAVQIHSGQPVQLS